MKAVRLTTAFAVVLGVVLPCPDASDAIAKDWAAENGAPRNGDLRQRAEDLAKSASDRFGEIVGGKEGQPKAPPAEGGGGAVGVVERIHNWTARSSADYQELMRGLSQPLQFNPVADAARSAARHAEQGPSGKRGLAQSFIETLIGWIHQAGTQYQTVVRGLLSEPGQTVVAAKGREEAKQAEDARRLTEILEAAEATKVGEARIAAARQAEEARRTAEVQKPAEAKKAEEDRVAAAKQAEEARRAEDARRVAEAQKGAEAKKAEEDRVAAAKQAEEARRAEDARRVAEAQKAAAEKEAEDARIAADKQAEDVRRVEETRRVADEHKAAEAKKAEEDRAAAARKDEDARRTEEARRVAEAQKIAEARKVQEQRPVAAGGRPTETKAPEASHTSTTPSRKRTAAQRRAERKERIAKKSAASRKLAVAGSRQYAKQAASVATGKARKKAAEHSCRMAGNRTNVPGWYVVRRGDTLWKIAARHYGKGKRYAVIYRANLRRIADPSRIVRCQRIYLPAFRRRSCA